METELTHTQYDFLAKLGIGKDNAASYRRGVWKSGGDTYQTNNPHNNKKIANVQFANMEDYEDCMKAMEEEKERWMSLPAPARGNIVREIGECLRANLTELGSLISLEMGKIKAEGIGEVQEFIDVCDLACGLSR